MGSQQIIMAGAERREMIIITFASAFIIAIIYLLLVRRRHVFLDFRLGSKALIFVSASCVFATYAINMFLYILSKMSISILSPINSSLTMSFAVLYSVLIFKERLSALKLCGIALALSGILILAIK